MSRGDAYLWAKFLEKNPDKYRNFSYDVRVGVKALIDKTAPDWLRKSAEMLSQKRIDVVMEDANKIYVVECRVNAKSGVIGDLVVYRHMYIKRFNPNRPVVPVLISDTPSASLIIAMKELKMVYFTV